MQTELINNVLARVDCWQPGKRLAGPTYGVIKKFGDDGVNQFVVGLGWCGFVAIYPLLLVVITILGFIGVSSLGHELVTTFHQFPVVGDQFNPAHGSENLHGNVFGLIVGLLALTYGAQGVTQTAQQAMARVRNVPQLNLPDDFPKADEPLPKFIDDRTMAKFMAAVAKDTDTRRRLMMELLARTGMRVGELASLEDDAMVQISETFWLRSPGGQAP